MKEQMIEMMKERICKFYADYLDDMIEDAKITDDPDSVTDQVINEEMPIIERWLDDSLYIGMITEIEYIELKDFADEVWSQVSDRFYKEVA